MKTSILLYVCIINNRNIQYHPIETLPFGTTMKIIAQIAENEKELTSTLLKNLGYFE